MNTRMIQWRPAEGKHFSAIIAGDFSPREQNSDDVAHRAEEITAAVKPYFESACLRILQWECAVTRSDTPILKSGPNHRCYPEALSFARALGIDAVLLANNHTGDYGKAGLSDTLNFFRREKIAAAGAGMTQEEAEAPLMLEYHGLKVALFNAAEHEFGIAEKGNPGSAGLDPIRLSTRIREARKSADTVIAALHGGHEHFGFPSPRLKQLCRFLADSGADAVFNCHTHCPLGYEIYNGKAIVYCPGNFYFPPRPTSLPCWYIGYLPKFYFDEKGAYQLEILPYYNRQQAIGLMDEADTKAFFGYLDTLCAPIADDGKLQRLFDAWCIRDGLNGYLGSLAGRKIPGSWEDPETVKEWIGIRNIFTCESHRDLLRNTLLLVQYGKLKEAAEELPAIEAQEKPLWLEGKL